MASQLTGAGNGGSVAGTSRRRVRTRRRARAASPTSGIRSGAATGIGGGGNAVNVQNLSPEQLKFYNLGAKHACEVHGINWSGGMFGRNR